MYPLQANPDPNCCLGVFGLSLYTTERDLREVFSKYGPIADVSIVYDQQSRRSRGFSFVYFENVEDAKEVSKNYCLLLESMQFMLVFCNPTILGSIGLLKLITYGLLPLTV